MKHMIFAILALTTASAFADSAQFVRHHNAAIAAHKACQSAWTQKRKERALDDLMDAYAQMVLLFDPLRNDTHEINRKIKSVNRMSASCRKIVYP